MDGFASINQKKNELTSEALIVLRKTTTTIQNQKEEHVSLALQKDQLKFQGKLSRISGGTENCKHAQYYMLVRQLALLYTICTVIKYLKFWQ